jgi:LemA protein
VVGGDPQNIRGGGAPLGESSVLQGAALRISPEAIGIGIGVVAVIWAITAFNGLIVLRTRVQTAWAQIDVQLKRRHDLIPNLVDAVRGYMQHERATLEAVTQARTQAMAAGGNIEQRSAAEGILTAALGRLFAIAENYPQLRAVESVQLLQEQITSTENRIAFARQFYNDKVMRYNQAQSTFPRNLLAGILGFSPSAMFTAEDSDRVNVTVKI